MFVAKDVNFSYDSDVLFQDLNLNVAKGEICVILGKSGSGKSTLINLFCELLQPKSGNITLFEDKLSVKKHNIALIPQSGGLLPWATVLENVLLGSSIKNQTNWQIKTDFILDKLEILDFKHRYPSQLSGGQKQRTLIARAFVQNAQLLLMDEPMSALDSYTRENAQNFIKSLDLSEIITVFVTHSLEEAVFLATKIVVLERGKIKHILPNERVERNSGIFFKKCNELRTVLTQTI